MSPRRGAIALAALAACLTAPAGAGAASPDPAIRVGGPSGPSESKVAIVGSDRRLAGKRFKVVSASGAVVARGRLKRAPGDPAPWDRAYAADLSGITEPGSYRVSVGALRSRPWQVTPEGGRPALAAILGFFAANRDGAEPSPVHGPAHLDDAPIHPAAPAHAGAQIGISGGWMDAGDMLHFTQTTAFAAVLLQAAARLDPADAGALNQEADVGVRWLAAAHPFPEAFVTQVGDQRDHQLGFRDPAADAASSQPGISPRYAYTLPPERVGGDIAGKTAAALAMAHQRSGSADLLAAAKQWYDAGRLSAAPSPNLVEAGYPREASDFYNSDHWQDSMAAGAVALYRSTGDAAYLDHLAGYLASRDSRPDATIGVVDSMAAFAAADACGVLGAPAIPAGPALDASCKLLRTNGEYAIANARRNSFGMPGFFSWGTTAQNGGSGAVAALAKAAPGGPKRGCAVAAGARDYLLGRNPFGASFIVGFGPKAPREPHHWASVFGAGLPAGAVVGGPAPVDQIRSQGFRTRGRLNSEFASYEDERANYVTSEPALDYAAASILLIAALEVHC